MTQYRISIVFIASSHRIDVEVNADEFESSDDIILELPMGGRVIKSSGSSYLEAYQELRDKLLGFGYGMECCGSLINAVQSGMMAQSPKVYLVSMGKQAKLDDIAGIWDKCDISDFPDTAAQNAFTEQWFASLKK
ncbi:MAG: hypothetical protein J5926_02485 [Ruminococcus sp.]|nr:hypothetical protein [Ruminococcus sp.]